MTGAIAPSKYRILETENTKIHPDKKNWEAGTKKPDYSRIRLFAIQTIFISILH
jgi:hypothetical protein